MLVKSVQTFRDYTTKNSNLFLLLAFLSKVTAYRVKSHLNRVLSYLSLSIKTSVVLFCHQHHHDILCSCCPFMFYANNSTFSLYDYIHGSCQGLRKQDDKMCVDSNKNKRSLVSKTDCPNFSCD